MVWLVQTLIAATMAFAATNIDDVVMLMLLFSQVPDRFTPYQIVLGRYIGFTALVGLSLPGLLGGFLLSDAWIGLLGLIPIGVGIADILQNNDDSEAQIVNSSPSVMNSQVASVAALTLANGGDNVGVYVSLFAGQDWKEFGFTLLIFAVLVGVWCGLAYLLLQHPFVGDRVARVGHRLMPLVLISLGVFILLEHRTYQLFI